MTIITTENFDEVSETCVASDQRAELKVGCETWPIFYSGGQRGDMSVWPDEGRGAVCWGGDSHWGEWIERTRTLILDETDETGAPITVNENGEVVGVYTVQHTQFGVTLTDDFTDESEARERYAEYCADADTTEAWLFNGAGEDATALAQYDRVRGHS